jgi:hypothetical protein
MGVNNLIAYGHVNRVDNHNHKYLAFQHSLISRQIAHACPCHIFLYFRERQERGELLHISEMLQEGQLYTSQRIFLCGFSWLPCLNPLCPPHDLAHALLCFLPYCTGRLEVSLIVLYLPVCLSLPQSELLEVKKPVWLSPPTEPVQSKMLSNDLVNKWAKLCQRPERMICLSRQTIFVNINSLCVFRLSNW